MWGRTYSEREALALEQAKRHPWFAWRPVRLEDGRWAWLEIVLRVRCFGRHDWAHHSWWAYHPFDPSTSQ